jgi:predicted permease
MNASRPAPPRLAEALLRRLTAHDERSFIVDDFREAFDERVAQLGLRAAKAWYWHETLHSLGPLMKNRWQVDSRPSRSSRTNGVESVRDFFGDAAYVLRSISRSPALAIAIALTLGLGIGAAATMYGVVDRLLLRGPEHVVDPGSLRRIYTQVRSKASGEFTTSTLGYVAYTILRDNARSVAQAAAYNLNQGRVGRGVNGVDAQVGSATADFFTLLGTRPALGRFFTAAEDSPPEGQRVVVLDHGYWEREFGGDPSAIGQKIVVNDEAFTVIGVAAPNFTGAELRPVDLWIPMSASFHPTKNWSTTWNAQWLNVLVRLKPGFTQQQVDEDLTLAFRAGYGGKEQAWQSASITGRNIGFTRSGKERPEAAIARWLTAVALLVLLIAAANVANLMLVRAWGRRYEITVRLALGVSRSRLARLLVLEGIAYAALGGAASIAVAYAGGEAMHRLLLSNISWGGPTVSSRVLVVAIALTVVVGTLISLAPIVQTLGTDVASTLRSGASASTARASRTRQSLLIVQTAFSMTLLIGAGLFIRSLANVRGLDLGVEPDKVLVVAVDFSTAGESSEEKSRSAAVWRDLRERIVNGPGVTHAALAIGSPFGNGFGVDVKVPGRDTLPTAPGGGPYISAVGADYFSTTGTALVRGREFTASDGAQSPRVAIVNETMAALLWPGDQPLGKCIMVDGGDCSTIVGVVRNARRYGIQEPASMQYYIPFGQEKSFGGTVLLVRPAGRARAFAGALRRAVAAAVPNANYIKITSMQDRVDPQIRPWRLGATMFGLFGAVALGIAAVGLYSGIAFATTQRTHEFGVRLAVGADGGRLMRGVLAGGLRTTGFGLLVGALVSLAAGTRVAPLLFGVSAHDPIVFGAVGITLLIVSVFASLIPAWKAARTDPLIVLRSS